MKTRKTIRRDYVIVVKVRSDNGDAPVVRTLGGDTVFISLVDGQTAKWTIKQVPKKRQNKSA
jgi:hypothetical protein